MIIEISILSLGTYAQPIDGQCYETSMVIPRRGAPDICAAEAIVERAEMVWVEETANPAYTNVTMEPRRSTSADVVNTQHIAHYAYVDCLHDAIRNVALAKPTVISVIYDALDRCTVKQAAAKTAWDRLVAAEAGSSTAGRWESPNVGWVTLAQLAAAYRFAKR